MTGAEVLEAIRARHLKANIDCHERDALAGEGQHATVHWDRAWLDTGGTVFGPGPYAKVPITLQFDRAITIASHSWTEDEITVRVYPPERLRKRLAAQWDGSRFPNGEPSDD